MKVLNGHPYHNYTNDMLKFVIKDAGEAAKCAKELGNADAESKYLDHINNASTILYYRSRKNS